MSFAIAIDSRDMTIVMTNLIRGGNLRSLEVLIRGPPKGLDRGDERVDQQLPRGVLLELRPNEIGRIAEFSDDSDATCRGPRREDVPDEGGHPSSSGH